MEDKQNVLSDLYTLRAGLSWISQQKQEINRLQNSVKVPARITSNEALIKAKDHVSELKGKLAEEQKKEKKEEENKKRISKIHIPFWRWLIHLVLLAAAVGLAYWGYIYMLEYTLESTFFVFSGIALIGSLWLGIPSHNEPINAIPLNTKNVDSKVYSNI